jgi:colanic acid/amylovoran biosynthesis protein
MSTSRTSSETIRPRDQRSFAMLVNCWDDSNKGDAAITIGVLNVLKRNGVAARFGVSSYAFHSDTQSLHAAFRHVRSQHSDVELIPGCLPSLTRSVGRTRGVWLLCRALLKLVLPNFVPDSDLEAAVRRSEVVVSNGGLYFGFVRSGLIWTLYHLFAFSYPMLVAGRTGVPYVLYAQSFGPFPGRVSRWWMKKLVARSLATWSRESHSQRLLESLGAPKDKIDMVPDAAFAIDTMDLRKEPSTGASGLPKGGYVAISLRALEGSGQSGRVREQYQLSFVRLITWLARNTDLVIALVAHTQGPVPEEDDRVACGEVYEKLPEPVQARVVRVDDDLSPLALAQLYGNAKQVIATRFHAAVLAMCGGAPVIAIPYFGLKTQGTFQDLGLSQNVITLDRLTPDVLISKVRNALNANLEIRAQIQRLALDCYNAAMESGSRLRLLLEQRSARSSVECSGDPKCGVGTRIEEEPA